MKTRFESWFLTVVIFLIVILLWSTWRTEAATPTNAPVSAAASSNSTTNHVAGTNIAPLKLGAGAQISLEVGKKLARRWPFLRHKLWGIPLGKYIFSLVYIFLAFYVSKLLDFLTRVWLKKWAKRTKTELDDLLLDLLNGPTKIVAFIIFLRIGLDVFQWPPLVQNILSKGFAIAVAITITYVVMKLVDMLMGYWHLKVKADSDQQFRDQIFPIIRKALKVFVVVVAALVTLSNIGVNITAAIASLSIGGLAVGLAAQDTLANLFGAVAILLDRPFRIGDYITLDNGAAGSVEIIGVRSTKVRNADGHLVAIPNKTMGAAVITNVSLRPNIKTVLNIGLSYDTPPEKVRRAVAILNEIYKNHPMTQDVWISFNQFNDSSLNINITHWWSSTDYLKYLDGMQESNLKIKERFEAEKIAFAFPTRTIHLKPETGN